MKGSKVVDAALIRVSPEQQQQFEDFENIWSCGGPGMRPAARQGCNQRRKPARVLVVGISLDFEQRADERKRAMVDGILKTRANGKRHGSIRHTVRLVDSRPERIQ